MNSRYYTNIFRAGDHLYVREVENGKRRKFKTTYKPTLYISTNKPSTLHAPDGTAVEPIQPGTMRECYQFLQKYKDVDNFRVYGNTGYEYTYINETYPIHIDYKLSELVICNLDIEVESKNGYSEAKDALNEVQAITMKCSTDGIFHVFACQPFDELAYNTEHQDTVIAYHQCEDERDLLFKFLDLWETAEPDIITGWNCLPASSTIWKQNEIASLSTIKAQDTLYDSTCLCVFPASMKVPYKATLSNGAEIISSDAHIFPVLYKEKNTYSNLQLNRKSKALAADWTMSEIANLKDTYDIYFQYTLRSNNNPGLVLDEIIVGDELLYVLGMLYTDGTAQIEDRPGIGCIVTGASFYNTQRPILERIKKCVDQYSHRRNPDDPDAGFSLDLRGIGTWRLKTSFGANNPFASLYSLVMSADGKKTLNINGLSKLSHSQWLSFLAGIIDGDGSVDNLAFTIVDYTEHGTRCLQELLAWNGIFAYRHGHSLRLPLDTKNSILCDLPLSHPTKKLLCDQIPFQRTHASNKNIAMAPSDSGYWLRIESIDSVGEPIRMLDIETDTHYFRSAAINTHNCRMYDIPYLINRISRLMSSNDAKRLSPWNQIRESTVNVFNNVEVVYDVAGLSILDYLMIYRKNVLEPRESYRLDYIAEVELNERKLDYSEHGSLHELYEKDFKRFIEYNIHDVRLVDRIDAKRKLIELQLIIAYHAHVNYVDVLSQVRTWDTLICNHLLSQGVVVPQKTDVDKDTQFTGAFVMKPAIGMHEWVASFDVQSLYPMIMRTLNMGMETKLPYKNLTPIMRKYQTFLNSHLMIADDEGKMNVNPDAIIEGVTEELWEEIKAHDVSVGANGVFYRRDPKSFYSVMIEALFAARLSSKKKTKEAKIMVDEIKKEMERRKSQKNMKLL